MAAAKISPLIEEVQEMGSWRTRMELLLLVLMPLPLRQLTNRGEI